MSDSKPTLAVVVPVRNEAGNAAALAHEIAAALRPLFSLLIVFVNDGSTDSTRQELEALQAAIPELRLLHHRQSCGQSAAIMTGVRHSSSDWIAVLDGDGQNNPADFPALWQWLQTQNGDAMAIGYRRDRKDADSRKSASRFANGFRNALLKDGCPDSGCGLKMLPRRLFERLPYFDHMHRFMPALVQRAGGTVASIPVSHRPRGQGVSNYTNWKRGLVGIPDVLGVWWLMRRSSLPDVETTATERG